MRNVSPIAEQELEAMFEEHKGDFAAICKALDAEMENGYDGRTEDQDAAWERFGIDAGEMRKARNAKPKKSDSAPEVQVTLAKLIDEQEAERRMEVKAWIQAQAEEKEKEDEEPVEDRVDEQSDSEEDQ